MCEKNNFESAVDEFKKILTMYILPILNIHTDLNLEIIEKNNHDYNYSLIKFDRVHNDRKNKKSIKKYNINFYPAIYDEKYEERNGYFNFMFYFRVENVCVSEGLKSRATEILKELLKVTEHNFNYIDYRRKNYYGRNNNSNDTYKLKTWDLAFELGMCNWITRTYNDSIILHKAIAKLVNWSSKTYEGERVPFGIIIDFNRPSNLIPGVDFLNFLDNDSSAVITDGMASGVLLNKEGCLLSYLTKDVVDRIIERDGRQKKIEKSQGGKILKNNKEKSKHKIFVPYPFKNLAKICYNMKIGIFVMDSGEIILVKNKEICFARRGNKWISFDWNRVNSSLSVFKTDPEVFISANNIREIYSTLLDVSFSHTGGCLAIIDKKHIKNHTIINYEDKIEDSFFTGKDENVFGKREEKKKIVENLLYDKHDYRIKTFYETDRILRKEILSLDGSTIITPDGRYICVGSIIRTNGTTISGGGRTAAAKTFAEYGIGIKISEDGYIEAYKRIESKTSKKFKEDDEPDIIFEFK